ncbi:ABC transporter permease [Rhodococcus maanshanensis]|uniref:ABC-2 type transport system permease protein n=1 Tax=Rhodococcus maanshanensis TaxID=183556 RepID=A0A1H7R094_9NOCA|nr:hypothetical protein [Rhodococcus maanshanensis]SEL53408.1 ABC-2 type transport system permease protein [Rhodococcus maanshanensis]
MNGYRRLLAIHWRSNRRVILAWALGLAAAFAATAWSIDSLYSTPEELAAYAAATEAGSAMEMINGTPYGVTNIGGVIAYEFGFVSAIAFPLMGIHLVVSMTRAEEQSGRMELLRAARIGRLATSGSAMTLVSGGLALVAASMAGTLALLGIGWPGVVLYPVSSALLGGCFAALALLGAQVVATPRAVTAIGLGALVFGFLARGVGDVRDNLVVWLSPIGWAEQSRPFADARWWPTLVSIGFVALAVTAALWAADRRDLGQGLFASRPGRTGAAPRLLGPYGFAARQHRAATVSWCVISALVGASFGSLADALRTMMADSETFREAFGGGGTDLDGYLAYVVTLLALIGLGFGLQSVGRIAEEERDGRLEMVMGAGTARNRWLAAHCLAVAGGMTAVALSGGLALGISDALAVGEPAAVPRFAAATLAYLPAMCAVPALALAAYCISPRLLGTGWLVFVVIAVVATLADALQMPDWMRDLSPLTWVGRVPGEPVHMWAVLITSVLALGFAVLAATGLGHRDIPGGSVHPLRYALRRAGFGGGRREVSSVV